MKFRTLIVAVVVAIAFYCASAFAADASSVGVINIQKIMMESKSGKEAKAAFEKELESKRAMLLSKEKGARAIEDDLKANGAKMTADARKSKEAKLAEEIKELRRVKQDMEDELKKKDNELTSGILKNVLALAQKVASERGYSLVLQAGPQIAYMSSAIDITGEVLKRYDSGK